MNCHPHRPALRVATPGASGLFPVRKAVKLHKIVMIIAGGNAGLATASLPKLHGGWTSSSSNRLLCMIISPAGRWRGREWLAAPKPLPAQRAA
jgi:hypothetical protein